ncbi:CPBP family intramembrane metalloprotease [Gordonia sp. (in: high G+C Gram-positive bacteria)]|uniref:CPBP family intramembrane glutamic endopeptidase n=1 Tax=Gordonia sp. (in: high G+C Gram-positive bacteria) TaxID=84139 RepID=UPI001D3BCA7D|nr:CPBP family intramembrane metalloprotease [Gordonia sp. (in: high G+C Gram-positive bacteria)]MCB1293716.1 CPBP family intramembrane metalloprotease [Gordonia sp. (in: high G+C Gram-positive bacteria)]HMS75921.1 CPBP family intramembrane metalloprotease [Gordonia sp. (in: high G+C Gram-positive bacteria)]
MRANLRLILRPPDRPGIDAVTDPVARRGIVIELVIVGVLTFGFSALSAALSLLEAQLAGGIGNTTIALNPATSDLAALDAIRRLMQATRLFAVAALGAYLLWRAGLLRKVGLGVGPVASDVPPALALAAVIGLPGLALVAVARALGINATLVPADADGLWWRWPLLILLAIGNGAAEEIVVVAYFITRLRQLGLTANGALASSALLRGGYHLYQGIGAGIGNVVMGLVFGRWYQLTNRVWPLVIAHSVMDIVAFVGYALLREHLGWIT